MLKVKFTSTFFILCTPNRVKANSDIMGSEIL